MRVIKADQVADFRMSGAAPVADANPAEYWQLMRDAAPTIDAVPVEELRELAERLLYTAEHADTRGYGPRQTARDCVGCIRALIAKHSR